MKASEIVRHVAVFIPVSETMEKYREIHMKQRLPYYDSVSMNLKVHLIDFVSLQLIGDCHDRSL